MVKLHKASAMKKFAKPIVVISRCIEFEPVRWNAQMISSEFVKKLKPYVDFIPVCPEVEIGLGVPRETLRIISRNSELRLIQSATNLDFTEKMREFANRFLDSLSEVDGFILKSGSPTSAFKDARVYPSTTKSAPIARGSGFFGREVLQRFSHLAIEDERRLLNSRIKEHFLTKLFTIADFREVKNSHSINKLISFHSYNKLLLTAYSQRELRVLGRIVAYQKKKPFAQIINDYAVHLYDSLKSPPRRGANINVMAKGMGYFSSKLSKEEKSFFISSIDKHREGKLPLSAVLNVLKAWIIRFHEDYLMKQTFFEPYPEELAETDVTAQKGDQKDYWT